MGSFLARYRETYLTLATTWRHRRDGRRAEQGAGLERVAGAGARIDSCADPTLSREGSPQAGCRHRRGALRTRRARESRWIRHCTTTQSAVAARRHPSGRGACGVRRRGRRCLVRDPPIAPHCALPVNDRECGRAHINGTDRDSAITADGLRIVYPGTLQRWLVVRPRTAEQLAQLGQDAQQLRYRDSTRSSERSAVIRRSERLSRGWRSYPSCRRMKCGSSFAPCCLSLRTTQWS